MVARAAALAVPLARTPSLRVERSVPGCLAFGSKRENFHGYQRWRAVEIRFETLRQLR